MTDTILDWTNLLVRWTHVIAGICWFAIRPGLEHATCYEAPFADVPDAIVVTSDAFPDGGAIPARFTQDGAKVNQTWIDSEASPQLRLQLVQERLDPTLDVCRNRWMYLLPLLCPLSTPPQTAMC